MASSGNLSDLSIFTPSNSRAFFTHLSAKTCNIFYCPSTWVLLGHHFKKYCCFVQVVNVSLFILVQKDGKLIFSYASDLRWSSVAIAIYFFENDAVENVGERNSANLHSFEISVSQLSWEIQCLLPDKGTFIESTCLNHWFIASSTSDNVSFLIFLAVPCIEAVIRLGLSFSCQMVWTISLGVEDKFRV